MSDDRLVNAHITELRTDDATVANNAIEIIAEGTLRPELVPVVQRLATPFAIRGMSRQDRSSYRDAVISMDQAQLAAQQAKRDTEAFLVWQHNAQLWADHLVNLKKHRKAGCSCVDPGPRP